MSLNIYLNLPPALQNFSLSAYGANQYNQRFRGEVPQAYKTLHSLFDKPSDNVLLNQQIRLRELLLHCKSFVPYYKPFLKDVDVNLVKGHDIPSIFPKLTKKIVLQNPELFISESKKFEKSQLIKLNTSGSSGTPLTLYSSQEARRINYHFYQLGLSHFGCTYKSKSTTFAGRLLYKSVGKNPARYDFFNRTQYLSSYFISEETIEHYINALNKWQPKFIDSYPSAIYQIQSLARSANLSLNFTPKFILTSSETLTDEHRKEIETFFGAPIIDQYGCTEMAICAFSNNNQYHAHPLYSVIELEETFDNHFSVIATGLLNFAMPLIRYEIGDLVTKASPESNYVFNSIEGRKDDVIVTPEGRHIGRMDPAFKGIEGIEQSQIIQTKQDHLRVVLVLDKNKSQNFNPMLLTENIKARTSPSMEVEIIYADNIAKTKNGKFKSVVSQIQGK